MSAIAQMVNVLQAMILTDDAKMVRTPTYWVFAMYKPYMDATVLPIDIASPGYGAGKWSMPAVSGSAVRDKAGKVHVGLANADPHRAITVEIKLDGVNAATASGRVLTAAQMNAHNDFAAPDAVKPAAFGDARIAGDTLTVTLPAKSVVMLDLQ